MKTILIAGIPGSGKTTLAKQLLQDGDVLIDDPYSFNKDVSPYFGSNLVITDPHLCCTNTRRLARDRLIKQNYIVFEILLLTPIDLCWERVRSRNDGRGITFKELEYFYARLSS